MLFVALILSHVRTSLRLQEANRELGDVRQKYGYMKVEDERKINVVSLAQERSHNRDALRLIVPPGERYFLHLHETTANNGEQFPGGKSKITVSLGWADGKDVILHYGMYFNPESDSPYLRVSSRNQEFFVYEPKEWPSGISLPVVFQLDATKQLELSPDEPITLMRAAAESIDREIVLWLETRSHRDARASRSPTK